MFNVAERDANQANAVKKSFPKFLKMWQNRDIHNIL